MGDNASRVNGIYEFTEEVSGGMPVYRKMDDPDMWLMYNPTRKEWWVQQTSSKVTGGGWAYLTCNPPCLPERGPKGMWQVYDGGKFQLQAGVAISMMTPEEVAAALALFAAEAEALAASVVADGRKVCVVFIC